MRLRRLQTLVAVDMPGLPDNPPTAAVAVMGRLDVDDLIDRFCRGWSGSQPGEARYETMRGEMEAAIEAVREDERRALAEGEIGINLRGVPLVRKNN